MSSTRRDPSAVGVPLGEVRGARELLALVSGRGCAAAVVLVLVRHRIEPGTVVAVDRSAARECRHDEVRRDHVAGVGLEVRMATGLAELEVAQDDRDVDEIRIARHDRGAVVARLLLARARAAVAIACVAIVALFVGRCRRRRRRNRRGGRRRSARGTRRPDSSAPTRNRASSRRGPSCCRRRTAPCPRACCRRTSSPRTADPAWGTSSA